MGFFSELKRRNVFRVGAAYVVLGWVVIQVTDTVAPALGLPDWTLALVTWIGIVGFPFALLLAWAFELTPEGIKREHEVDRSQSITHVTGRKLDFAIIGLLVVALGFVVWDSYLSEPGEVVATEIPAESAEPAPVEQTPASIAVLPFVDMSADKDQEYFSDGISEELLNLLARVPGLKVAGRTSSFAFKGENTDLREIGAMLNVSTLLEGSVRKSGNTLRITAQLINVADGFHLWSDTYDRELTDVFAIQDEIAAAVVEQLKIKLLGTAPKAQRVDPEAYALFLRANQLYSRYGHDFDQSIVLYQQALAIEPNFAAAWSAMADAYIDQTFLGRIPTPEGIGQARDAANKALTIDPEHAPAHSTLGWIANRYDNDLTAAARHYEQALALAPADTWILQSAASFAAVLGQVESSIALVEFLVTRDPKNPTLYGNLAWYYLMNGNLDKTITNGRAALALSPDMIEAHFNIGTAMLLKGDYEGALTEMQAEPEEAWRLHGLAIAYHVLGRSAASEAALAELIAKYETNWASSVAKVLALRGERDRAFEWLNKAVAYGDTGVASFPIHLEYANLHDDPRWLPLLESLGKSPTQLAAIEFNVTLPE